MLSTARILGRCTLQRFVSAQNSSTSSVANTNNQPDKLYEKIEVEVRAHQPDVLKSYSWFATTAAKELNITVLEAIAEPQPHKVRKTLLLEQN